MNTMRTQEQPFTQHRQQEWATRVRRHHQRELAALVRQHGDALRDGVANERKRGFLRPQRQPWEASPFATRDWLCAAPRENELTWVVVTLGLTFAMGACMVAFYGTVHPIFGRLLEIVREVSGR